MDLTASRSISSPSKRQKVSFDSEVEVMSVDDEWGLDPLVIKEEVRRAIQQHLNGSDESYDYIKGLFKADPTRPDAPTPNTIKVHLQAVLANIALLDKNCGGLVNALLQMEWVGRDGHFVTLYTKFLGNLAAAQSGYLTRTFALLVDVLGDIKTRRLPSLPVVRPSLMHARAHTAIQYLLQLIPIGSSMLSKVLARRVQYSTALDTLESDIVLTKNALKMLQYVPELKSEILTIITSEIVKIDVQVQVELDDLEDDVGDELVHEVSLRSNLKYRSSLVLHRENVSDEEVQSDVNNDSESDVDEDEEDDDDFYEQRLKAVKASIEKVDSLLDLVFQYYDNSFSGSLEVRESSVELLLSHFHNIILPTHRSRHTQFLIFHFAQTSPLLIDRFATSCVQLIFDRRQPAVLRQSAAAYLASFVARGAHVPAAVVRDVFELLGGQVETMRGDSEPTCRGPDLRRFSSFYCMTQALLYIFCYRWKDLSMQEDEDDDDYIDGDDATVTFSHAVREPLHQAIYSKLNPLRVCSPHIVNEFARIAHHLNFLYIYPKLEMNKKVRLSSYRLVASSDPGIIQPDRDSSGLGQGTILESYFPFDPYSLPRSKRWIEGDYIAWQGVDEDVDDSGAETDTSDDEVAVETGEVATGTDEDEADEA